MKLNGVDSISSIIYASGKPQRTIAAALGKSPTYLSNILSASHCPSLDKAAAIAHACGYSLQLVPDDGGESITIDPAEK